MSITCNRQKIIQALFFLNLTVLLVLPQLNNVHYDPLPQFWAEATAVWAAISLFLLTIFSFKRISIPHIIIPLALLAIFISLQQFVVSIDFVGLSYTAGMEFILCILASISISSIQAEYGLAKTLYMLCYALLIGAILQSLIGVIQYTGTFHHFGGMIFYDSEHPTTDIFGHFGQRNHYCHYLTWSIFGLIYLFNSRKIKSMVFLPLIVWLIFSITIAGSRSVFIYFFLASLISAIYCITKRRSTADGVQKADSKNLFITILLTSIVLVIFEYAYPIIHNIIYHHNQISSGLQRIATDYSGCGVTGRRMVEWQKAWIVFKTHPLWGCGFNEYAKQSVLLQPLFPNAPLNDGLFTNCHNLILQLLAETGLIGTLITIIGILYSLYLIIKNNSIESVIILCMIFTTLSHSMVEYPLWYIYFLIPLAMFLATGKPLFTTSSNLTAGISTLPLAFIVYFLITGSLLYNTLVEYNDPPSGLSEQQDFITQAKYLDNLVKHNTLWSYPALYALDNYINIDDANTNKTFSIRNQLLLENQFSDFHPYPDNLIKQAQLNWIKGNDEKAFELVRLALVAYPVYQKTFISTLSDKHGKYKELLKIATKYKYK